ncbi:MAG: hypothetical protein AAGJ74_03330 [Pseudomonadota bacterium]
MIRLPAAAASAAIALALTAAFAAPPAAAELSPDQQRLFEALGLPATIEIMREEGVEYGAQLESTMFPGRGGSSWIAIVEQIYDTGAMTATVADEFGTALSGTDITPLLDFFASERGQEIISFEITARQAFTDPDIETAANERMRQMRVDDDPRLTLLDQFIDTNDLIGSNLMGAMNANWAFYQGLAEGGGVDDAVTDEQMLLNIWEQEDEVRAETELWVYSYLALAYQPLADEDLEAYIALSQSEEGQALNRALFSAFDAMYNTIHRGLGLAASRFMVGEDI